METETNTPRRRRKKSSPPEAETAITASGADEDLTDVRAEGPTLPLAWGKIVDSTLVVKDPEALAKRLREELILGEERSTYASVSYALDRSASNLYAASRLARAAKLVDEKFRIDCESRFAEMRDTALRELMYEYNAKARKSPTKDDIEGRVMANDPEEYRELRERHGEIHGATRVLESLRDAWQSRTADLRALADKATHVQIKG
jgi:hypothetical protein